MKVSSSLLKGSYSKYFQTFFPVSSLYEFFRLDKDLCIVNLGILMYTREYNQKA